MCLQYCKRHTYMKIFIVYLKSRFQWGILCLIWQPALLMPDRWINLPFHTGLFMPSSVLEIFSILPLIHMIFWCCFLKSQLWALEFCKYELRIQQYAVDGPGHLCALFNIWAFVQFLFIFSILPPETGVLPWTPVYLARTHTWFFNLANFLPGAVGLDPFSQLLAGLLTKLDGSLKPVSDAVAFLSCLLQRLNKSLK